MNALRPAWLVARPIAHRGLHQAHGGILENSLSAAEAAAARGYAIECDVQDTSDGEAVVFHDHTLDRLTAARGPVRERAAAELTALTLKGSRDRIPTLSAFLDQVAGRVPLVIEIKSRFDGATTLARRTCEVVSAYAGPVAFKSFDPAVVEALRTLAPDHPRGIIAQSSYEGREWDKLGPDQKHSLANLLHLVETEPDFLSWRVGDLPSAVPFLCHHVGQMPVMAWTVRTGPERDRATAHADQIVFEGLDPLP